MNRSGYYQEMLQLAHEKRTLYALTTPTINLAKVGRIYKQEGIELDLWSHRLRHLKAAYYNDPYGCSVLVNRMLPRAPRLFAQVHELKHHYKDRDVLGLSCVEVTDESSMREIGAEVFAAEFIFPEEEFLQYVKDAGITTTPSAEDVVNLMYYSPAIISYQFILKRLERLMLIQKGYFKNIHFQKLHTRIYGSPHFRHSRLSSTKSLS